MTVYFKSCLLAFFCGLTTVMLIYGIGVGSYNSQTCRGQYNYSVEYEYGCRLLGFPTSYIENDVWGHNAHVYPLEFVLNVLFWSLAWYALLILLRPYVTRVFKALSTTNRATRSAVILESLTIPLIVLIFVSDLPIRQGDLRDIYFRIVNPWSVLYLPIPIITFLGLLVGTAGLFHKSRAWHSYGSAVERSLRQIVLYLPFCIAVWNIIVMIFVGLIPEVV